MNYLNTNKESILEFYKNIIKNEQKTECKKITWRNSSSIEIL